MFNPKHELKVGDLIKVVRRSNVSDPDGTQFSSVHHDVRGSGGYRIGHIGRIVQIDIGTITQQRRYRISGKQWFLYRDEVIKVV